MAEGQEIPGVEPHPLPVTVSFGVVEFTREEEDGSVAHAKMVRASFATPAGVAVVFFRPEEAVAVGEKLAETGGVAKVGLEVVRRGLIGGNGSGP